MKKFTLLFSVFLFLTSLNVKGQGIDSLNYTSTYITVGETWYTDYYTSYSVYNNRSFFKDENDDLHTVFISNYKLNYSFSSDSGNTWVTEEIVTDLDGTFKLAVIYADADGNPYIAATVNPHFNYGNPTNIDYTEEFRYNAYFFFKEDGEWMEENVYMSGTSNYGMEVSELYMDENGDLVLIGNRFGWYTYGGAIYEYTRSEGVWSDLNIIHEFTEGSDNHFTFYSYSVLDSDGTRDIIFSRHSYNIVAPELLSIHFDGENWEEPNSITGDLHNFRAWDMTTDNDGGSWLAYFSNNPSADIKLSIGLEEPATPDIDLSLVDTIQTIKIHYTNNGLLDLIVYPLNVDSAILYVSEDYGLTWGEPMYTERGLFAGVLPARDQLSEQSTDLEFISISRVSNIEPFGPDSLFYNHIEQINTVSLGVADIEEQEDSFLFYPNPFTDELTLEYDLIAASELNLKIYSLQGKVVMSRNYNAVPGKTTLKLDLGDLDAGTYIVEVFEEDSQRRIAKKIFKMPMK